MKNRYALCYLCEETVYYYKKYSNKSSDNFFNRYRSIKKNDRVFCIQCYKYIYVTKHIKIKNF
ncbi:ac43 [Erannis ankeraria nucleopolyhedrovirus]|uniref:ac43 n=1 Tax=Erannis ankeraria nucleopolyhedrovirus TaxID=2913600 RepID=UPI002481B947|nr:ac43 [Erannis ankeraria nucleopolyhedrovirus]UJZ89058.1 ac43 [Erannis ankeraria nucleopolyhedrovirus]